MNPTTHKTWKWRAWTPDEIATVQRMYPTTRVADIAACIGRTRGGVQRMASVLDLKKRHHWTTREIQTLRAMYPIFSGHDIAKVLCVSTTQVSNQASRLKLSNRGSAERQTA
jgi:hypothetical protein